MSSHRTGLVAACIVALAIAASGCLPDPGPLYPPPGDGTPADSTTSDGPAGGDGQTHKDTGVPLGDGTPADKGGGGDTTKPPPDTAPPQTTFNQIYNQVLKPSCGCHDSASHGSGLTIQTANSAYANLVGKAARGAGPCSGRTLVTASDSAASVLFHKINGGGQLCGNQMPRNAAKLSGTLINLVKQWIDEGAKR